MKFSVTIRKAGSSDQTRIIEADSRFTVYEQMKKEGADIIALTEKNSGLNLPKWFSYSIGTGIKRHEIIQLTKSLSAMLGAGLSLSRALSILERQSSNAYLRKVIAALSESIKNGVSFHEALAVHHEIFPELFVAMVKAGEESGSLTDALSIVGLQMERSEELIRKIKGAMIYPAIVIAAIIIVSVLMLIYVVPTLTSTFTALGVKVPLATRAIVAISNFMVAHIAIVFTGIIAFVLGCVFFVRSKIGARIILSLALRMPVIRELVRETYAARTARTISSLLSSGVPVLNTLSITKEVVHAEVFAEVIREAEEHVRKGELLSAAFSKHAKIYPILMSDMLMVGEETGKVAEMLKQIAEFYEKDVAERTKDLSTIIEPILMLLIGAIVGVFAVSMIAPIYQLSSAI